MKKRNSIMQKQLSFGGKIKITERVLLAKHLSVMMRAGLTISEAISVAENGSKGKMKRILQQVLSSIKAGNSLAESFAHHSKHFSEMFINIVAAGEQGGTLEENLEHLANQLEKDRELKSKIKGAMIYPVVVLIATVVLGLGMTFFVFPQITPLFSGLDVELPFTTRTLIWISESVENNGILILLGTFGSISFLLWITRQKFSQPVTHFLLNNLPVVKEITRGANLMRFSLILGTLLKSGLTVDESLEITRRTVNNFYYKRAVADVLAKVKRGSKISDQLKKHDNIFPLLVINLIRVGEQSGKLDETLIYISEFYELEVDTATKSLTTALEPILLLVIGSAVAFLALAVITPIYEITGSVR